MWIATKTKLRPGDPLFRVPDKRTAEMIRKDLAAARTQWLKEIEDPQERERLAATSFLAYENEHGHVIDFHALRKTFITNLTRSGTSPKTAQALARHSDINLTMNTYTMLGVWDQSAAVEALPPIPTQPQGNKTSAARLNGTDSPVHRNRAERSSEGDNVRLAIARVSDKFRA